MDRLGDCWLINLADRKDRLLRFTAENKIIVRRFEAVSPEVNSREIMLAEGIIEPSNAYTLPALCCARSHIDLWKQCRDSDRPITIFEDDTILHADFHEHSHQLAATIQDWDIILWGWNLDTSLTIEIIPGLWPARLSFAHDKNSANYKTSQSSQVDPRLMPLHVAAGLLAYSLSSAGAASLLDRCLPLGNIAASAPEKGFSGWTNTGIDVETSRHYTAMRAFVCLPPIAYPVYSPSSIWVD